MAAPFHVETKSAWKTVHVDQSLFSGDSLASFVSFQELKDYEIVDRSSGKKTKSSTSRSVKVKRKAQVNIQETELQTSRPNKKKSTHKKTEILIKPKESSKKKRKHIQEDEAAVVCKKMSACTTSSTTTSTSSSRPSDNVPRDILMTSEWRGLFVADPVVRALHERGFTTPTPIQALTLPSAIRDRMDIVGAAQTGSGKTLAFGIPIITRILRDVSSNRLEGDTKSPEETNSSDVDSAASQPEDPQSTDRDENTNKRKLLSLILTPTRELAVQIKKHLNVVTKYTDIQVSIVVGGLSQQKQERLLRKHPDIVVATPGRLWQLIQQGNEHLSSLENVKYLVIDEADRMVEKGHFKELEHIFEMLNENERKKAQRQVFVFSATLTLVHGGPKRIFKKKSKLTQKNKLESLVSSIGIKAKHKVIDLTKNAALVDTLTEAKISCTAEEKDIYLYYFLTQHPGRTLVFANSKDCVRRLVSVFTLLNTNPRPLHAEMHQKQRLKNLEKFTESETGLLLATDVAARGLDIPNIQHVVHYQVPHTTETYVHRSGRTARALRQGITVMLIGPQDVKNYRRIILNLEKKQDLPEFNVDQAYLSVAADRVNQARQIDQYDHRFMKQKRSNDWLTKAAQEMDLELDDNALNDLGDKGEEKKHKKHLKQMKDQLNQILKGPMIPRQFSGKYITKTGRLVNPIAQSFLKVDAISALKNK